MPTFKILRSRGASLEFPAGEPIICDAVIRHTAESGIRATCDVGRRQALRHWMSTTADPVRLAGTLDNGEPFSLEGVFHQVHVSGPRVTFICDGPSPLRIGSIASPPGRLVCTLANCFFPADEPIQAGPSGWYRGATTLMVDGRSIRLEHRRGAIEGRAALRGGQRSGVTARAIVDVENADDRDAALAVVDRLVYLLTFVTGTLVSRLSWTHKDEGGRILGQVIESPPMRSFSSHEIIDRHDSAAFKRFVQTAYPAFVQLDEPYQIRKVIHARIDTFAAGFLETRSLTAAALIDYLVSVYARVHTLRRPLLGAYFRKRLPEFRCGLGGLLSSVFGSPPLVEEDRQEMIGRAQWFNERTFRQKLAFFSAGLNLPFSEEELGQIVKTRNCLVHGMEFHGGHGSATTEWKQLTHFTGVALLRLFGYRGRYLDCRTWQTQMLD